MLITIELLLLGGLFCWLSVKNYDFLDMWTNIQFEDTAAESSTSKSDSAPNTSFDITGLNLACGGRSTKGFENHPVSST